MTEADTKAMLLEDIARERGKFLAALEGTTDEEMLRIGIKPGWCLGDVVAHLAAWERRMVRRLHAMRRGSRRRAELPTKDFNELVFRKNHGRPLPEIKREASRAFRSALRCVEGLSETELRDPAIHALVKANTYSHYRWASARVRAWNRAGRDSRGRWR